MNLSEMNSQELQALKSKWYQEAADNISRLFSIARYLGQRLQHNYGPKYRYEKEGLNIYVDDYGGYMTVHLNEKLIVSTHNEKLYIPGEWESVIPQLGLMADTIKSEREKTKEERAKNELLDELTLPEPKSNLHPLFQEILKPYMP